MSKLHFTTKHANAATVKRDWYVVDGTNQTVGRLCAKIAAVLRGKNKAYYTPHVDCGDYIIVINADKVVFSGNKMEEKIYINYSGYPGGKKEEIAKDLLKRRPEAVPDHHHRSPRRPRQSERVRTAEPTDRLQRVAPAADRRP